MTIRRARLVAVIGLVVAVASGSAAMASSDDGDGFQTALQVRMSGFEENPLAVSTTGNGDFRLRIDEASQEISYELSYADLEAPVTQAHIHIGLTAQTGGISVFLCTNLGNGPAGTQLCPAAPATVTGVIRPADVIGPAGQGVAAGEFAELIAAFRAGATYVNVHSTRYPVGELRAQLVHQH